MKFVLGSISAQNSPLPIDVKTFKATGKNKKVYLDWSISNNDQFESYIIERSNDGIHFEALMTISATPTLTQASYMDMDTKPLDGWNYYRLRAIDQQQQVFYSAVQRVWMGISTRIEIGPVPTHDKLSVYMSNPESIIELQVTNSVGQVLYQTRTIQAVTGINVASIPQGMYYLRIVGKNETTVKPFMKQ